MQLARPVVLSVSRLPLSPALRISLLVPSSPCQSLGWTTVYVAAIGVVWVLFGLGFLVFLLIICVCCRFKWRSLRDGNPKYSKRQLTLPLLFMLVGVILEW